MAFDIPTLGGLLKRTRESFRAYLPGSDAWLWPNNIYAAAKVIAGVASEVMAFADYIAQQKFAGTADSEHLVLHGQEYGLARRPAGPSAGAVMMSASSALTVDAGAVFRRTDGFEYIAAAAGELASAGDLTIAVTAAADGAAGNAEAGTPLEIISGVTGDALAEVGSDGIVGGLDIEPDGELWTTDLGTFRGRILFHKRNEPMGGSPADYVRWASEVSGVTRVFVEKVWNGAGTVRVFPLLDDMREYGIPTDADLLRIADYIETVAPAGAVVSVSRAEAVPVDIEITDLLPDTTATRDSVESELRAAFRRMSRVAGISPPHPAMPYLAAPTSFSVSWIWQAVANASGENRHKITAPTDDVALTPGQMPVPGAISYVITP